MIEKIYFNLYFFATLILGALMIINNCIYGEMESVTPYVERDVIVLWYIANVLLFAFIYFMYQRLKRRPLSFKGSYLIEFNPNKIHRYLFIILCIKLIALLVYNTGKVLVEGSNHSSSLIASVANLFGINSVMLFYMIYGREKKNNLYWINVVLYVLLETLSGWSGQILTVIITQAYLFEKENETFSNLLRKVGSILPVAILYLGGSALYMIYYPLKNSIRYPGLSMSVFRISYFEAFEKLVQRFTFFPSAVGAITNEKLVVAGYHNQGIFLSEFKAFFRPLIPSVLFKNKNIHTVANLAQLSTWNVFADSINNSTEIGILSYFKILFSCDLLDGLLCLILGIVCFFITMQVIRSFNKNDDKSIVYIIFFTYLITAGSSEAVYSRSFVIGDIYTWIALILLGAIRFIISTKNEYWLGCHNYANQ